MQCNLVEHSGQYATQAPAGHVAMPHPARRLLHAAIVFTLGTAALPAWAVDGTVPADCDAPAHFRVLAPEAMPAPAARAYWLDGKTVRWIGLSPARGTRVVLAHAASTTLVARRGAPVRGADGLVALETPDAPRPRATEERFVFAGSGATYAVPAGTDVARLLTGQAWLVHLDARGLVLDAVALQHPAALDALYAPATGVGDLGARPGAQAGFALWAPTAQAVSVCGYPGANAPADAHVALVRDPATGVWRGGAPLARHGRAYTYLVDVVVPGHGLVRNRVTDPYSFGLTANSARSVVLSLDDPRTKPADWDVVPRPKPLPAPVDMVVYELHVRDFSRDDATVPAAWRGKYMAFAHRDSAGSQHLRRLADAGVTDIHLLPTYDLSTVPERGCVVPDVPAGAPDGEAQQAAVMAVADRDCFNWGYDPFHYTTPEGSYATDPDDAFARTREFRAMVMAMHRSGLRVGMDVVYNHTMASGQSPLSVLDRIVPGYYHRLDANGVVERSTCCDNTATEHAMMAKLMIDSAVVWARDYRIDSFRFDLMGHQPREAMERLQVAVDQAAGRHIDLIGEGWNFGEVADGKRFVQAAQGSLQGSGIATFSDRARDAMRGGGCCDSGAALIEGQGVLSGLHYAPNAANAGRDRRAELLRAMDLARVGLAGTLRGVALYTHDGHMVTLDMIDYAGQPAGYAAHPGEVVNYVENHDNPTLFDILALKLPRDTTPEDRARVQLLGVAYVTFAQGIAYHHAGVEVLRSKSLDRNSFNSGDRFNRLDWSGTDNGFGAGLPPHPDNGKDWALLAPVLADARIKPAPAQIAWMREAFLDLLRIRKGSTLFRMRTTTDVAARLSFRNDGPEQNPVVLAAHLDGRDYPGAGFREVLYFINVAPEAQVLTLTEDAGKAWRLHPVQASPDAADQRPRREARVDVASGRFTVPGRTAVVFVVP